MNNLYRQDLAYIQATGFVDFAGGVAPEITRRLRSAAIPVREVVEAGCGAGPLTHALVNANFKVTGIDVSGELLAIARQTVPSAKFVHNSIYEQGIPPCEAILAVGEPLTYHDVGNPDDLVRDFFARAADILPKGGLLIFDVIELGEPPLSGKSWKAGIDWAVLVDTQEDQTLRVLVRDIETFRKVGDLYRRGHEVHRVRLFDTAELCECLEKAGFRVSTEGSYGEFRLPPRRKAFFCVRR